MGNQYRRFVFDGSKDPDKVIVMVTKQLERVESLLSTIHTLTELVMADKQAILDEIQGLRQMIRDDNAKDQKALDALASANQALRAQIQAIQKDATTVEASDLNDILAQLEDVKTQIQPVNVDAALQQIASNAQSGDTTTAITDPIGTVTNNDPVASDTSGTPPTDPTIPTGETPVP